jgi:hypothetical protein
LLVNNVIGFQGILNYRIEDRDSSFVGTEVEPIVSSEDPNFRPADVEVGPDGAIYFTDWHNPIIGHMQHNLRDPSRDQEHGRVYRVRMADRPLLPTVAIHGRSIPELLTLLQERDDRVRYRTRIELSGRSTQEVIEATTAWLEQLDPQDDNYQHHVLEALWVHQSHNVVDAALLDRVLTSPDFRARAAGTRVLAYWRDRLDAPLDQLQQLVNDQHPRVRLQAIWALSFFNGADVERASEIVVESLIHPQDEYIKHTLEETTKTLDRRSRAGRKS